MLSFASASAAFFAWLIMAAFIALYGMPPPASRPQIDAMWTIAPPPCARMCGVTARVARTAASILAAYACLPAVIVIRETNPRRC